MKNKLFQSPLKTHFIQLRIISNFQSGRDTHLRLVKVFGPIRFF